MSRQSPLWTFVRFALVGGSFSLFYGVATAGLIRFAQTPPLPTSVIIYLICIPLAYLAQKHFAFRSGQAARAGLWIYGATQVASLIVVASVTSRFVTRHLLYDTVLYVVTAGLAAVISFLICRYVIFRPSGSAAR